MLVVIGIFTAGTGVIAEKIQKSENLSRQNALSSFENATLFSGLLYWLLPTRRQQTLYRDFWKALSLSTLR